MERFSVLYCLGGRQTRAEARAGAGARTLVFVTLLLQSSRQGAMEDC